MSGMPGKPCAECGKRFYRRKSESNYGFTSRRYCSSRCEVESMPRPSLVGLWEAFAKGEKL